MHHRLCRNVRLNSIIARAGKKALKKKEKSLQIIKGASDTGRTLIKNMGVNHRGFDIAMAKQFLDRTDIVAIFKQMCGKRVPERMTGGSFHQVSLDYGLMNGTLNTAFIHVKSALLAG